MIDKSIFVTNDIFYINAVKIEDDGTSEDAIPGKVYNFIEFKGCGYERVIFSLNDISFSSSETDTVEIVDEDGNALYSYDKSIDGNASTTIKLEFKIPSKPSSEKQSIGFRWVKDGGQVNATLTGRIIMIPSENYLTFANRF